MIGKKKKTSCKYVIYKKKNIFRFMMIHISIYSSFKLIVMDYVRKFSYK